MGRDFGVWAGLVASGLTLMTVIAAALMSASAQAVNDPAGTTADPASLRQADTER